MLWLALAFVTACAEATKDLVSKKTMQSASPGFVSWALVTATAPLIVATLLLGPDPLPTPSLLFLPAILSTITLYVVAILLYMKALKASDLSLTLPMIAFTPAFMLLTGPVVLGELPTPLGIAGVLTLVVGAYVLNFEDIRKGLFRPLLSLAREPGPRYMLGVAFIFSITAVTAKVAITESSPLFSMSSLYCGAAIVVTTIMVARRKVTVSSVRQHWKGMVLIALLVAVSEVCLAHAITYTLAVYVISVKRVSILIGALLGFIVFKEKNLGPRLLGALIMLAGLALMTLGER